MILKQRRNFLKNSFLSSVILLTCGSELFAAVSPMQTISMLQKDLFPSVGSVLLSEDINANFYLNRILTHSRVKVEDKIFIRDGVKWLNEEAVAKYKKVYTKLSSAQRQKILIEISDTGWGDSWLETIMTYLMEAMLCDPIYGGNRGEIGWKWLNHQGGFPRPTKALL